MTRTNWRVVRLRPEQSRDGSFPQEKKVSRHCHSTVGGPIQKEGEGEISLANLTRGQKSMKERDLFHKWFST